MLNVELRKWFFVFFVLHKYFLMKLVFITLLVLISHELKAQTDSLSSQVINWTNLKADKNDAGERRLVLQGSTLDLGNLRVHASTLDPGKTNHPPRAHTDYEELIIVKEGNLKILINDSSKIVGPGGIALIVAGDEQSFQNVTGRPVTYYVLRFKSKSPVNIPRGKEGGGSFTKDWLELVIKKTDKGERRDIFNRPSSMFGNFEVHATALNPGFDSHAPHKHRAEEIILMIKGDVTMQIGNDFYKTTAGDLTFLASGDLHAAKNTGSEQCGYFAIQWRL